MIVYVLLSKRDPESLTQTERSLLCKEYGSDTVFLRTEGGEEIGAEELLEQGAEAIVLPCLARHKDREGEVVWLHRADSPGMICQLSAVKPSTDPEFIREAGSVIRHLWQ